MPIESVLLRSYPPDRNCRFSAEQQFVLRQRFPNQYVLPKNDVFIVKINWIRNLSVFCSRLIHLHILRWLSSIGSRSSVRCSFSLLSLALLLKRNAECLKRFGNIIKLKIEENQYLEIQNFLSTFREEIQNMIFQLISQLLTKANSGSSSPSIPKSNSPPPVPSSFLQIGEDKRASNNFASPGTTTTFEPLPSLYKKHILM